MKLSIIPFYFSVILIGLSNFTYADLTIDGKGNTLTLNSGGILKVGAGKTLTLKDLTLTNLNGERIIMTNATSKLKLDNAKIVLDDSYSFSQGSMEIINNSSIEGEFTFTFSGHNLLIRNASELKIGYNTTFVCTPTGGLNTPIRFQTDTSSLFLDNATLKNNNIDYQDNYLGLIFSNGKLVVDGTSYIQNVGSTTDQGLMLGTGPTSYGDCKLVIKPNANLTIQNAGLIYNNSGSKSFNIAGNIQTQNDANFVLATNSIPLASLNFLSSSDVNLTGLNTLNINNKNLKLDTPKLSGQAGIGTISSLSLLDSADYGTAIWGLNFSPDGKRIAIGGESPTNGNEIQIYEFDGSSLTLLTNAQVDTGGNFYSINWSPDGKHIAIGGNNASNGNEVQVYQFDGASLTLTSSAQVDYGTGVYSVNWSPDGKYLAIGGGYPINGNELQVYQFDGNSLTLLSNAQADYGSQVNSVNWSSDGKYIAIGGSSATNGNEIQIYQFDGNSLTLLTNAQVNYGTVIRSVKWSPDGKYIAIGGFAPTNGNEVQVYEFDGSSLTLLSNAQADYGLQVNSVNWSSDGKHLAVGGSNSNELQIYSIAYEDAPSSLKIDNGKISLQRSVKLETINLSVE